jgi:ATP-dependent helicase/nuclease subunit A
MPSANDDGEEGEGWLMCPGSARDDCPASRAAREARVARTDAETLRLLYVALTRARDRLVVMGRAVRRPETGFEPGSWWSVIAETFDRLAGEDPLNVRDIGDGVLRFGVDPATLATGVPAPVTPAAVPAWARLIPAPDGAARFASPSKMDETTRIPAPSPLASTAGPGAPLGRFRRGDLIHRLLERLPDIAPADRAEAARRMLSRERDLDDARRAEMIGAAVSILDDARFAPVFGEGSRAEVALTGSAADVPISGRMDRLVVTPDRVLVIDYKTNRPAPAAVEQADPAYIRQLALYVSILRQLYPGRRVEAALVWTDGPRLMPVPDALMAAALIR